MSVEEIKTLRRMRRTEEKSLRHIEMYSMGTRKFKELFEENNDVERMRAAVRKLNDKRDSRDL